MNDHNQPNCAEMPLFKYMPREYLDAFFQRGSLKIGTLHDYRKIERYGDAIGDEAEGISITSFTVPGGGVIDMGDDSAEARFLRSTHALAGLGAGVTFTMGETGIVKSVHESKNLFIFCATSEFDAKVMNEFGGACFEILDPKKFFAAVSHEILPEGHYLGHAPITYQSREVHWKAPHTVDPALIKEGKYAYQKEIRVAWEPKRAVVEPLFIDVPAAIKYCRVVVPAM